MSDQVNFVAINPFRFASSVFVYVNSPICRNPAQATLKAVLILTSLTELGLFYLIFYQISLMMGKQSFLV